MLPIPMYQLGSWEPLGMFPFPEHKERILMYIDYHGGLGLAVNENKFNFNEGGLSFVLKRSY